MMSRFFRRIGVKQDRPDISRHRKRWRTYQGLIDPRRLVFIDETWTKTNMTRLRGWAGQNGFTLDGITWTLGSGVAHTDKGTNPGVDAAPEGMGTDTTTGTTYMGVQRDSSETATFSTPQTSLSIYWGSIDGDVCVAGSSSCGNLNSIGITLDGFTLTGADLIGNDCELGEGLQGNPVDNQLVTIKGLDPFTTVTFATTGNAFEFSFVPALGFVGLGYAAVRRSSKDRSALAN
jgi:hypothetical protein